MRNQRRRGGFSIGACNRNNPRRRIVKRPIPLPEGAEEQTNVIVYRNTRHMSRRNCTVRCGVKVGNTGGRHQTGHPVQPIAQWIMDHKPRRNSPRATRLAIVPAQHLSTPGLQRYRRRKARPTKAQHQHPLPLKADHRDHRTRPFILAEKLNSNAAPKTTARSPGTSSAPPANHTKRMTPTASQFNYERALTAPSTSPTRSKPGSKR